MLVGGGGGAKRKPFRLFVTSVQVKGGAWSSELALVVVVVGGGESCSQRCIRKGSPGRGRWTGSCRCCCCCAASAWIRKSRNMLEVEDDGSKPKGIKPSSDKMTCSIKEFMSTPFDSIICTVISESGTPQAFKASARTTARFMSSLVVRNSPTLLLWT